MDEVIAETASLLLYESQERKVQIHIELEPDKEYRIFSTESDMRTKCVSCHAQRRTTSSSFG